MTANEINQILAAAANGMSADQIADMLDDQDAEGRMDALHAFDNDDSDWASEQRAEAAKKLKEESFVVEITQKELESGGKGKKVLH